MLSYAGGQRMLGVHRGTVELAAVEPIANMGSALTELLKASDYAAFARRDVWDFAVGIRSLQTAGMTESDLRWLVCRGYAEHAREITRIDDTSRQFRPLANLSFSRRTCFVLTQEGISFARSALNGGYGTPPRTFAVAEPSDGSCARSISVPAWDGERHELWFGRLLIKQYRWPAANQELILAAFDEEGWPARIDDPLPPQAEQDSKRRLHDTIKSLNKNQKVALIHFRGDGTGEGILWELVAQKHPAYYEG